MRIALVAALLRIVDWHRYQVLIDETHDRILLSEHHSEVELKEIASRTAVEAELESIRPWEEDEFPWTYEPVIAPDHSWLPTDLLDYSVLITTSCRQHASTSRVKAARLQPTVKDGVSLGATLNSQVDS